MTNGLGLRWSVRIVDVSKAEIANDGRAVRAKKHVRRFDIAMNHLGGVNRAHTIANLLEDPHALIAVAS